MQEVSKGVFYVGNGQWATKSHLESEARLHKAVEKKFFHLLLGNNFEVHEKRKLQNQDNRKWAIVRVGRTRKMCWVDTVTGKAYKADGYSKTHVEIKKFTFVRWCTTFDL